MFDYRNTDSRRTQRLVDFVVLALSLYASCMFLSLEAGSSLFFHILAYSIILLGFLRLCKGAIAYYYPSIGELTCQILGNAAGILTGTCIMLLLEKFLSTQNDIFVAIMLSGALAFFVLGTLGSLLHETPPDRNSSARQKPYKEIAPQKARCSAKGSIG